MALTPGRRLPTRTALTAASLLAIPVLALLAVPLYARATPKLWGLPFFYWYQFLWVFLAAGLTYTAFVVIQRARRAGQR
jgi:hypothetical protein